jgi:hypothetical protein
VLAKELGASETRAHQIGAEADKKVRAAAANTNSASLLRFPTWRNIDEWCDRPKEQRDRSIAEWRGACDHQINRVSNALDAGLSAHEIGEKLDIPRTTVEDPSHNPTAHFVQMVEWRRRAEEQDRQQKERVLAYREHRILSTGSC